MAEPPAADWASLPADVHLAVQRHLSLAERCHCLCVCRGWHAAGAGLHELWECVEAGSLNEYEQEISDPLLRWLAAWCATPQRPLRRLELDLYDLIIAPDVAAGLVAVLRRSSTSLLHLRLEHSNSLWEQLVRGKRARKSGFLAAIAALQQLTSLGIGSRVTSHVLPPSTVLPTSLQRVDYVCGELRRQVTQLTRLEHVSLGHTTPLAASLASLPSLRGLHVQCREVPAQLAQLTRLEELRLYGHHLVCGTDQHVTALTRLTRLTLLGLDCTAFRALPSSWTALSSLRKLELDRPGSLGAEGALHPLDSWTQLTSLRINGYETSCTPGSLEHQVTRLSALQHLRIGDLRDFELPPGRWQRQLTSLECEVGHVLPADGSPSSAAAVLAHATALSRLRVCGWGYDCGEPTQPQLRALLGALAALPALELVQLRGGRQLENEVEEVDTKLDSPLGARLQFCAW